MAKSSLRHLLWVDIETTGLSITSDDMLEIGAILTDADLNIIEEYSSLVRPRVAAFDRMMDNDFLVKMHTDNGLLPAHLAVEYPVRVPSALDVELALLDLIERNGVESEAWALSGSGVAKFDFHIVARQMPTLMAGAAYFVPYDTGVLRRTYQLATGDDLTDINESKTHRGLDDIRCHLEEGRAFRDYFRRR